MIALHCIYPSSMNYDLYHFIYVHNCFPSSCPHTKPSALFEVPLTGGFSVATTLDPATYANLSRVFV
jgi:hypothetical protein